MPGPTQADKIAELQLWQRELQVRLEEVRKQLDQLAKQVESLREEIARIVRRLDSVDEWKAEAKSSRDEWGKRAWGLGQALLLLAAGSVFGYLVKR